MASPIVISVVGDVRDLVRGVGTAKGELNGLGKYASGAGRAVGAGLLAAGAGAVALGVKIKGSASDAQQSLGATETVYGRFADVVVKRSEEAAEAVGLSANEYRELANVLGASLTGAGVPLRKATELTGTLNARAADLAATFGGPTSEAVAAIGSLLRGEADPIERYGISIKESDVQARLAAKGLDELEGAAAKQAAMQERVAMLLDKSAGSAGAFSREADTAAGAEQRLAAATENLSARAGDLLLPVYTDVVQLLAREAVPALEDLVGWVEDNRDELAELGGTLKDSVLPVLGTFADLVVDVVGVVADLPGPVQALAFQAGAAALVVPRLTGALRGVSAAAAVTVGNLRNAETRTKALGGIARNAAGIGGVLALAGASQTSSKALGVLGDTAGGALLGFSVAGPIGAAIGGGVGLLKGLWDVTRDNTAAAEAHAAAAELEAEAIGRIAAASGRARREEALRLIETEGDIIPAARELGIETNVLVAALLGNDKALKRINGSWKNHQGILDAQNISKVTGYLEEQGLKLKGAEEALAEHREGLKRWDGKLKDTGTEVDRTNGKIKGLGDVKPSGRFVDLYLGQLDDADRRGRDKIGDAVAGVEGAVAGARPDLGGFTTAYLGKLSALETLGRTGGTRIGSDTGAGLVAGLGSWLGEAFTAGAALVGEALRGGREKAETRSPSKQTRKLGRDLGAGLTIGLRESEEAAGKAGRKLVKRVLDDLRNAISRTRAELVELRQARRDYEAQLAAAAVATANVTGLGLREDGTQTAAGLVEGLEARLDAIRNYNAKVRELIDLGLTGPALQQLLDAGVDAGTVTAEALLAGGQSAVADVVQLQQEIAAAAGQLGNIGGQEFHAAGIAAQAALLDGLEADRDRLKETAGRIARALAKRIRAELRGDLDDYDRVTRGGRRDRLADPGRRTRVDATAAGTTAQRIEVQLSAEQLSQLERGRRIALDLDAYTVASTGRSYAR